GPAVREPEQRHAERRCAARSQSRNARPEHESAVRQAPAGPGRRALRQGAAGARRHDSVARALCAARQQLPRLRLRALLGRDSTRRGAEAGGMAALITGSAAEFAGAVPHGKLAGLDVGTKTIGLALCDAGWHFAGPAKTIRRTKFTQDLKALNEFTSHENIV